MKPLHQLISLGKLNNSVQELLAEARRYAYPENERQRKSYSHLQIHFPPTKINRHLKELLTMHLNESKKIERSKSIGSAMLLQNKQQEQLPQSLNMSVKSRSPKEQKGANRYELKDQQDKNDSFIVHRRFRRQFDTKKSIHCSKLPNISLKANYKSIQKKQQQKIKLVKRSLSTIDQKYKDSLSPSYLKELKSLNTISHNQSINKINLQKKVYRRKLKSSLMLKIQQRKDYKLSLKKIKLNRQLTEELPSDPRPWQVSYKDYQTTNYNM